MMRSLFLLLCTMAAALGQPAGNIGVYQTIGSLTNTAPNAQQPLRAVLGLYAPGDMGGIKLMLYLPNDTNAVDGLTYFPTQTGIGRWVMQSIGSTTSFFTNSVFTPVVYCPEDDTWHELSAMKIGSSYLVAIEQAGTNSITPATYASSKALNLKAWAMADAYAFQSVAYSTGTAITNAVIAWPDGGTGILNVTHWNGSFEAIDAYSASHTGYGMTVIQNRMYRDATSGVITNRPVPTVTSP